MDDLKQLAGLLRQRNALDESIARLIDRPAITGHLGEYVAAKVFDIDLEVSAVTKAIDGRFRLGALAGRTVNIKCYGRQESLLDISVGDGPDYYLVLTGPKGALPTSRGSSRPWCVQQVYLFDHTELLGAMVGRKIGIASSVRKALWDAAEIYPEAHNPLLPLSNGQRDLLRLFA